MINLPKCALLHVTLGEVQRKTRPFDLKHVLKVSHRILEPSGTKSYHNLALGKMKWQHIFPSDAHMDQKDTLGYSLF